MDRPLRDGRLILDGGQTVQLSLPASTGPYVQVAATGATLQQGTLEGSNTDTAEAMTQMMNAQESYSMDSQAVQYQSQMLQIADQLRSGS